jgi:hypothetical protein
MSIQGLIDDWISRGEVFCLLPWLPSIKTARLIYVSRTVRAFIDSGDDRAGYLHANLDSFIGGDLITASMTPRKAGKAYMGLLHPTDDGIWDIRSRDPSPALRLLGGFARRDAFVGLVLYARKSLGAFGDRAWSVAITDCKAEWRRRFHPYSPVTGDDLHDYLSNGSRVD